MAEEKNDKVFIGANITQEAHEKLIKIAKEERRSKSKQIEYMIMEYNPVSENLS